MTGSPTGMTHTGAQVEAAEDQGGRILCLGVSMGSPILSVHDGSLLDDTRGFVFPL